MITDLERLYRQQTFLLEINHEREEVEPEDPYAWLPPDLRPRKNVAQETAEDRRASFRCLHPDDLVVGYEEDEVLFDAQIKDLRQLALSNGACPVEAAVSFQEDDYFTAEDLSNEAWNDIDPGREDSLCGQAFACGAFGSDDAGLIKERIRAEVSSWDGDQSILGEIEYLSAAGQMARLAHEKLAEGGPPILAQLKDRCCDYASFRTEYLSGLGLLGRP